MDETLNRTTLTDLIGFIDKEHGNHSSSIVNFAIFLEISTVLLNVSLTYIIISEKKLRQQSAYLQVINTCVSSFLTGVFVIPLSIYSELHMWKLGQTICHFWITMDVYLPFVAILIFIFINIDRLLLLSGLHRYSNCSNIFIVINLIAPWIIAILIIFPIWIEGALMTLQNVELCLVHLNEDAALLSPIMTYFIPSWICIVLTCAILIRTFRNESPHVIESFIERNGITARSSAQQVCLNKDTLSMGSLCFANYIYLTLWFPHQFVSALLAFCEHCYPPYNVLVGITWLGAISSMICPLLWLTDGNIRQAIRVLITTQKCSRSSSTISSPDSNEIELLDNCERSTSL